MRERSVAARVRSRIKRGGSDKLWSYSSFPNLSLSAVAASLSRLAKEGVVERVRKGVYYVPKETRFGKTRPLPEEVAKTVLESRGIKWKLSGLPMYNKLGLTTQVSAVPSFDVESSTRSVFIGDKRRVRIVGERRCSMSSEERTVLDALRTLKYIPDSSPDTSLDKIAKLFRSGGLDFNRVVKLALDEPPRVRALMGLIGTINGRTEKEISVLRKTLNPTTAFKIGFLAHALAAARWNIK